MTFPPRQSGTDGWGDEPNDRDWDPTQSPPEQVTCLRAPSKARVWEWSLVLASQGIQSTIVKSPHEERWGLWVAEQEASPALQVLKTYHQENRSREPREEPPPPAPSVDALFHSGSGLWCAFVVFFYATDRYFGGQLRDSGLMDNAAVRDGEWWRLFTAVTLHQDASHLVANLTTGFLLLGLAMARFGVGIAPLLTYLAGVVGNLAGLFLYGESHRSLGASGAVLAALGLLSVHALAGSHWKSAAVQRALISGLCAGIMLFTLIGVSPRGNVDMIAHIGGFVAGGGFGVLLSFLPHPVRLHPLSDVIALLLLLALVAGSWWAALW